jgi:SAM-dependent methyltransferase
LGAVIVASLADVEPSGWQPVARCAGCGGEDILRRYFAKWGFWHSWCRSCDLVFVDPLPPDDILDRLYNGAYYTAVREHVEAPRARTTPGEAALFSVPTEILDGALSRVVALTSPGCWLELGGGIGSFAHRVRLAVPECDVRLLEPGDSARALASEIYGLVGPAAGQRFDVVSLIAVLEHARDPGALLREAAGWARPGGTILIFVPRFSRLCRKLSKASSATVVPPFHLSLFDESSLRALLGRCEQLAAFETWVEGPPAFSPVDMVDFAELWDVEVPTAESQAPAGRQLEAYDSTTSQLLAMLALVTPRLRELLLEIDGGLYLGAIATVGGPDLT